MVSCKRVHLNLGCSIGWLNEHVPIFCRPALTAQLTWLQRASTTRCVHRCRSRDDMIPQAIVIFNKKTNHCPAWLISVFSFFCFFINETHIFDGSDVFECFYFCLLSPISRKQVEITLISLKSKKINKCAFLVTKKNKHLQNI